MKRTRLQLHARVEKKLKNYLLRVIFRLVYIPLQLLRFSSLALGKSNATRVAKKIAGIDTLCNAFRSDLPKARWFSELLRAHFWKKEDRLFILTSVYIL